MTSATPASGMFRAKSGLHPLRVEHLEGTGEQSLELHLERIEGDDSKAAELSILLPTQY
ncbi:hypothetical protein [Novipirellula artificiosorum]|uniref:Uncharacterized protein n=1 Tax=Novipirellula artificiosorum TaxID=2528016 RepID=A0A5C6DDT3_9BACT|nr:hypothetical protein [Novipirellula artificiosorum]TWU33376.1 hypothetical protein Poly41_51300 [Novipirellula artificiosorum]